MNDFLKTNWASVARWIANAIAGHFALKGNLEELIFSLLTILGTLVWTIVENQNKAKADQPPTGIPPTPPAPKIGLFLIPCFILSATGCATGVFTTKNLATIAEQAAYQGAKYEMAKDGSSIAAFDAGVSALRGLLARQDYDPAHFAAAIRSLKINELKSQEASIAVSAVVILWEPYASRITTLDEENKVMPILEAVERGLSRAISEAIGQQPQPAPATTN